MDGLESDGALEDDNSTKSAFSQIAEDNNSESWIDSAKELANIDGPVSSGEVKIDLTELSEEQLEFLLDQTERILDRHETIEQAQQKLAHNVLKVVLATMGVFITALPFFSQFLNSIEYSTTTWWLGGLGFIFLITTMALLEQVAFDLINVVDATFDILSPEATHRGAIGAIMQIAGIMKTQDHDEESGSEVRTVSMFDELAPAIDQAPNANLRMHLINNRQNRIRRNERVINQNASNLRKIFQRSKLALERIIGIVTLLTITATLLGVRL